MFLKQTLIEILNDQVPRGGFRFVLFDFDGTISLIREGWQQVMIPMMVDLLAECPEAEDRDSLEHLVKAYVARSTGVQTVYQMIWLSDEINQRGGKVLEPLVYKDMYNERLDGRIRERIEALQAGQVDPDDWMVPGSRQMLEGLQALDCTLLCASGTDREYMNFEAELLGVSQYFNGGLYGATDDYRHFSKKILIDRIIEDNRAGWRRLSDLR